MDHDSQGPGTTGGGVEVAQATDWLRWAAPHSTLRLVAQGERPRRTGDHPHTSPFASMERRLGIVSPPRGWIPVSGHENDERGWKGDKDGWIGICVVQAGVLDPSRGIGMGTGEGGLRMMDGEMGAEWNKRRMPNV